MVTRLIASVLVGVLVFAFAVPIGAIDASRASMSLEQRLQAFDQKVQEIEAAGGIYTDADIQELEALVSIEELKFDTKRKVEEELNNQLAQNSLTRTSTVNLGTNAYFTDADYKYDWISRSGLVVNQGKSSVNLSMKSAEVYSYLRGGVYGSEAVGVYLGKKFTVVGSNSQSANISMLGIHGGSLASFVAGSSTADIDIELVVKNINNGVEWSTKILSASRSFGSWPYNLTTYNKGVQLNLQAGHSYYVYVKIIAGTAMSALGGQVESAWGYDPNRIVTYASISVTF